MLEIACFNEQSALKAASAGADRIELCAAYPQGGVSPSPACVSHVGKTIEQPVNVMIRPRPGDFIYTKEEYEQMRVFLEKVKYSGASGFVFGILDENNRVDVERNKFLVDLANPLPCTFHRAFDQVPDMEQATEQIIECGFKCILTSGGKPDAVSGVGVVKQLSEKFGDRIQYILGGGVRSTNIGQLRRKAGVEWYHSAAITGDGEDVDGEEVKRLQSALKE
jgi:copper homeostasis protein